MFGTGPLGHIKAALADDRQQRGWANARYFEDSMAIHGTNHGPGVKAAGTLAQMSWMRKMIWGFWMAYTLLGTRLRNTLELLLDQSLAGLNLLAIGVEHVDGDFELE
jgi:hypothetical protein